MADADIKDVNFYILEKEYRAWVTHIIDSFMSIIWTDRYCGYGDFELQITADQYDPAVYKKNNYIVRDGSDHIMIIETITTHKSYNNDEGDYYLISGRSFESILERRVVDRIYDTIWWADKPTVDDNGLSGNIQDDIISLWMYLFYGMDGDSYIEDSYRMLGRVSWMGSGMPHSSFDYTNNEEDILGKTLYDVVVSLCQHCDPIETWPSKWKGRWPDESTDGYPKRFNLGFKASLAEDSGIIYFELYNGVDRSYNQTKNKVVEFSNFFDNLGSFDYTESDENWKNAAMIRGNFLKQKKIPQEDSKGNVVKDDKGNIQYETKKDDKGEVLKDKDGNIQYKYEYDDYYIYQNVRIPLTADDDDGWNIGRREIFVDSDVERRKRNKDGDLTDNLLTEKQFTKKMKQQGFKALYEYRERQEYSVELIDDVQYSYGKDYGLGDIVSVVLEGKGSLEARITEVTCSWDQNGLRVFPTFELI